MATFNEIKKYSQKWSFFDSVKYFTLSFYPFIKLSKCNSRITMLEESRTITKMFQSASA